MPSADLAEKEDEHRLLAALRAVPRALREDLWKTQHDPLPLMRPQWIGWLPVLWAALVVLAAFLAVATMNQLAFDYKLGTMYAVLLGGVQSAALVVAMFRPVPAWWAVTIVMFIVARVSEHRITGDVLYPWTGPGIAVQSGVLLLLAFRDRPRVAVEALTISLLAGLASSMLISQPHNSDFGRATAILTTAVVVGVALRGRRVARAELVVQEEITAEERARRTLLEERTRIARELHDVVAHHMSVISIQAQVAPHVAEGKPEKLQETLAGIRENAVEALNELRQVLGVLRSENAPPEGMLQTPQPTLDQMEELVGNVRGAGLTVTTQTTGEPCPLSPGVELSAFRIVQEALSNAMRHAPGAAVRVEIAYQPDRLTIRVTNTAPDKQGPPSQGVGHGLMGMRERATMLGGDLAVGPTPDGGYEVIATLPANAPHLPADSVEDSP